MPIVEEPTTYVGLDVHAKKTVLAGLDGVTGEVRTRQLSNCGDLDVVEAVVGFGPAVRAAYEAGPTGYGLYRALVGAGVPTIVAAPSLICRAPGDKVKTDVRDAQLLARLLAADQLVAVTVPSPALEGFRDLVRAREDLRCDLTAAKQRVLALVLRHGERFDKDTFWTREHVAWLHRLRLGDGAQFALHEYLGTVDVLVARRDRLDTEIERRSLDGPWTPTILRLRALKGVDWTTAAGLFVETRDFDRFATATAFMSFMGLVPSQHSSGSSVRYGPITKTGSSHGRRLLIEATFQYVRAPHRGAVLNARLLDQSARVQNISWEAQRRLHRTFTRLTAAKKHHNLVRVAMARELCGFVWDLGRTPPRE